MLEKVTYMCFYAAFGADFLLCIRKKPRSFCTVGVLGAFRARGQGFYASTAFSLAYNPHFLPLGLRALPALLNAIAMACFCGLPAFISALMLAETAFCELPFLSGTVPGSQLF